MKISFQLSRKKKNNQLMIKSWEGLKVKRSEKIKDEWQFEVEI